jgi:hypothetical protein
MMQNTQIPINGLSIINNKPRYKKEPSLQDKQACWLEWQNSGMNKTDFCRQRKMSTATFYRWTRELGQLIPAVTTPALIPATVLATPSPENKSEVLPTTHANVVDIWLPNGIHLRAPIGSGLNGLTTFIREINHVSPTNTLS